MYDESAPASASPVPESPSAPDLSGWCLRAALPSAADDPLSALCRPLVEYAPDMLGLHAPDGRWLYASPAAASVAGLSSETLQNQPLAFWIHPDDVDRVSQALTRALSDDLSGGAQTVEFRLGPQDQDRRWVQSSFRPMQNAEGCPVALVSVTRDITARRTEEELLRRGERGARHLLQRATDALLLHTPDGTLLEVNDAAEALTGIARDTLLRRNVAELVAPEERPRIPVVGEVLRFRGEMTFETLLVGPEDRPVPVEIRSRIVDHEGSPAVLNFARDISERKTMENALRESERRFRETLENIRLYALGLDASGHITFCNDYFLETSGWSRDEVLGRHWFDEISSPQSPVPGQRFQECLRRGQIFPHHESDFLNRQGERRRVRWNNTLLRGLDGAVQGTLSIGEDITDQRRGEWLERKARIQAEALNKVVQAVGVHQEMDELLRRVDQQLNRFVEIPFLLVVLHDPQGGEWRLAYFRGALPPPERCADGDKGLPGFVLREGKPLHLPDEESVRAFERHAGPLCVGEVQSLMAVPLLFAGRALGTMVAFSRDPEIAFAPDDLAFFAAVASPVAMAVENARLFAEMGHLAMTDALTELVNRRHLFVLGEYECTRARRHRTPLSVFMFDLDHFKAVNDRYGHRVGDAVLHHVAQLCRRSLREEDLLGRYGGEEFAAILPGTPLREALEVAERLRHAVECHPLLLDDEPLPLTVSVGVASLAPETPPCALETLLDRADQALYSAKRQGRNQVVGAPEPSPTRPEPPRRSRLGSSRHRM